MLANSGDLICDSGNLKANARRTNRDMTSPIHHQFDEEIEGTSSPRLPNFLGRQRSSQVIS